MAHVSVKPKRQLRSRVMPFAGFSAPTSNTTFAPNQYFDVCVPHYSRGVVRLVGYLIRQALGWCDADGNPQHERIRLSYGELVTKAGISRGEIRKALDEAIRGNFIECVQEGKASRAYTSAESACYRLRWDDGAQYRKNPQEFRGFFGGQGNRTDIPNQFFDHILAQEPLSVVKVVAAVIRFSIGFQAGRGQRRQQLQLSYTQIQRYTQLRDRHTLAAALRQAEGRHYIVKLQEGVFDCNAGRLSRPATFALCWVDRPTGLITPPAKSAEIRSENPPGLVQKPTGSPVRKPHRYRNETKK